MKTPEKEVVWEDEQTIDRILHAACGYAGLQGRHLCVQGGGCVKTDWEGMKAEIVRALRGELRYLLDGADHDVRDCGCDAHHNIEERIRSLPRSSRAEEQKRWHRSFEVGRGYWCRCCRSWTQE